MKQILKVVIVIEIFFILTGFILSLPWVRQIIGGTETKGFREIMNETGEAFIFLNGALFVWMPFVAPFVLVLIIVFSKISVERYNNRLIRIIGFLSLYATVFMAIGSLLDIMISLTCEGEFCMYTLPLLIMVPVGIICSIAAIPFWRQVYIKLKR